MTSSLFHTVYDQDFTLQTANELFDITMGIYQGSDTVTSASANPARDANEKRLFVSQSLMMREKINVYRQHAQLLLGNSDSRFTSPNSNATTNDNIDEALFINFKRLFVRDGIKRETFAIRLIQSSSQPVNATESIPVTFTIFSTSGGSSIKTFVKVTGINSGISKVFEVRINNPS